MSSQRLLPLLGLLLPLTGCGTTRVAAPVAAKPLPATPSSPMATGTWEWTYRSTDDQGNMRVEQEEWHLVQRGRAVQGYYDRVVTMLSTDDRLFRCNQQLGYSRATRVQVTGSTAGDEVRLQEVAFEAKPGPCDDGARNLVHYFGKLRGPTMDLVWEHDAHTGMTASQTLFRVERPEIEDAPVAAAPISMPIDGTWEWELRSIDAEGDERVEHEEWHLHETAEGIAGYYDRKVSRVRGDGVFTCAASDRYETLTRYTIAGQRRANRLSLTETEYRVPPPAVGKKCDNGQRRLDHYQGTVSPDGDELTLSWGPGNQLLRRTR